jgi:hypothetical protein
MTIEIIYYLLIFTIKVKTHSQEPPKWMDTFSNNIFVSLKNHKGNIIVWIVIIVFEIFSINCKIFILKA